MWMGPVWTVLSFQQRNTRVCQRWRHLRRGQNVNFHLSVSSSGGLWSIRRCFYSTHKNHFFTSTWLKTSQQICSSKVRSQSCCNCSDKMPNYWKHKSHWQIPQNLRPVAEKEQIYFLSSQTLFCEVHLWSEHLAVTAGWPSCGSHMWQVSWMSQTPLPPLPTEGLQRQFGPNTVYTYGSKGNLGKIQCTHMAGWLDVTDPLGPPTEGFKRKYGQYALFKLVWWGNKRQSGVDFAPQLPQHWF